ncbi:MAG: Undecaprenyl-phosphate 4-deoxy-4-formamido-L-arabinose transferase [Chlamydiae bacterium]|nr:Undecaprenyl-phosphate 4-deoxy-4-formamido-L-arabinose transferase [Chlamydiota bacterium]
MGQATTAKNLNNTIRYSIVIPIKNEEENITPLIEEIEPVMKGLGLPWELICIDDGSTDRSLHILQNLCREKPYLRVLSFSRNFGQSAAFSAGFSVARGELVITLDGDRQNDPADIPRLTAAMPEHDLVVGWRVERKDPLRKKIVSKFSNWIRSSLCQDGIHDTGCSLKVYRKEALDKIKMYHGMHRFLPALFLIEGFRVKEIPVNHRKRAKGETKYHFFNRSLGPIYDLFVVRWMRKRALHPIIREEYTHEEWKR